MKRLTSGDIKILVSSLLFIPLAAFLSLDINYENEVLTIKPKSAADFSGCITAVVGAITAGSALLNNNDNDSHEDGKDDENQ